MHRSPFAPTAARYLIKYTSVVIPNSEKIRDAGKRAQMDLRRRFPRTTSPSRHDGFGLHLSYLKWAYLKWIPNDADTCDQRLPSMDDQNLASNVFIRQIFAERKRVVLT